MKNLTIINNPVINRVALELHNVNVKPHEYREYARQLGMQMGLELASRGIIPVKQETVETPLGSLSATVADDKNIGIVNILRAGTTMALGMGDAYPNSTISFVSAWRREKDGVMVADTDYNRGIEDLKDKFVILCDPALASGSSLLATIEVISDFIDISKTIICSLHVAKEGVENISSKYPEIQMFTVFGPSEVNDHCYIINGPGDCGDRCFNTK